jgi:hypothetical protein
MKLPTIASLVFLSSTTVSRAAAATAASHQQQRHPFIRHLQEDANTTCEESYNELHNNSQLLEFSEPYRENYFAAVALDEANILEMCDISGSGMMCDFRQTVDGQEAFESACTALGAEIITFDYSIDCDIAVDDTNTTTWSMMFTEAADCVPAGCEEQVLAMIAGAGDSFAGVLEGSFTLAMSNTSGVVPSVSCGVGDTGSPDTGSPDIDTPPESGNNTEPDGGNETTTSGAASVGSKMLLSVLITALLSMISPAM